MEFTSFIKRKSDDKIIIQNPEEQEEQFVEEENNNQDELYEVKRELEDLKQRLNAITDFLRKDNKSYQLDKKNILMRLSILEMSAENERKAFYRARIPLDTKEIVRCKKSGMSNRDIAKKFGCSEGTVRNRLRENNS